MNRIKEVRENTFVQAEKNGKTIVKRMTQKQLAKEVGVDPNYIAMLEHDRANLTDGMAYKIAKACNVHPDYLLGLSDNPNASRQLDFQSEHEKSILWNNLIKMTAEKSGYLMERVKRDSISVGDIEELRQSPTCIFRNEYGSFTFSMEESNELIEDIQEYAVFRLKRMIRKKGE